MTPAIAAIVPTRDRRTLAMAAVRSLIEQDAPAEIFVSDNSPEPDDALRAFCGAFADRGVAYLRPPVSFPQPAHWDWALREAMRRSSATHFTVHYDRKLSKPNQLGLLCEAAGQHPQAVICWPHDYVSDLPPPTRLWQPPWTGRLYELRSARYVELTAAGRAGAIPTAALPLLSNCLVPREVLAAVVARFGDLCDSTTPDSCFAFRFAALFDAYLYLDRPTAILYAPERGAGSGYLRGGTGTAFGELRSAWRDDQWLADAPIPGLCLGLNMLYHEYGRLRREGGAGFGPVDRAHYLDDLAGGLSLVPERRVRAELRRRLLAEGWHGRDRRARLHGWLRHRLLGLLDARLGLRLPGTMGRAFRDDSAAVRHALAHPRPRSESARHLEILSPRPAARGQCAGAAAGQAAPAA